MISKWKRHLNELTGTGLCGNNALFSLLSEYDVAVSYRHDIMNTFEISTSGRDSADVIEGIDQGIQLTFGALEREVKSQRN